MGCLWDIITAPFRFCLWLIGLILDATGRLLSLLIGLAICAIGVALCFTLVGAVVGVPLIIFGGGLMLKCIF